jgi:hypothetical protein
MSCLLILAESSEEDARRLHTHTVTENEGILTTEFPLDRQYANDCTKEQ